jgi:hypothetical protein
MKRILVGIALLLSFSAVNVLAAADQNYGGHFGDMDKNSDKQVTWDEFKAFFSHAQETKFQEADLDKNGTIDHNEWHQFKEKYGYGHKQQ